MRKPGRHRFLFKRLVQSSDPHNGSTAATRASFPSSEAMAAASSSSSPVLTPFKEGLFKGKVRRFDPMASRFAGVYPRLERGALA